MNTDYPSNPQTEARPSRPQTIALPSGREGIGNALRSAFDANNWGVPDDMRRLLAQLDREPGQPVGAPG